MRYVKRDKKEMASVQTELTRTQKYNCTKAKQYLQETYCGICAYCESDVNPTGYFEVEHFYPKKKRNDILSSYALDIHNLHYSCKRCNNIKLAKEDSILSPNYYKKNPQSKSNRWIGGDKNAAIRLQKKIRYVGHLLFSEDEQGNNTIELFHLNNQYEDRGSLVEARLRCYCQATFLLEIIYFKTKAFVDQKSNKAVDIEEPKDFFLSDIKFHIQQLRSMMDHGAPYSQMIIDNFQIPLYQIMRIIEREIGNCS